MAEANKCPKIKPREPLDDDFPDGYMQSDKDFVNCNIEAAAWLLENELGKSESDDKLTLGYRARIKPGSSWGDDGYANREVILAERNGGDWSVMVLKEGTNVPLDEHWQTVEDEVAWVSEKDLDLVDKDIDTNIRFMDWYHEHEDDFCPDCGFFDENVLAKHDYYKHCPKCDCEWAE